MRLFERNKIRAILSSKNNPKRKSLKNVSAKDHRWKRLKNGTSWEKTLSLEANP